MNRDDIVRYFEQLGAELERRGVTGEIVFADGAFMLLVVRNRETTKDVDAYFSPSLRRSAMRHASWLEIVARYVPQRLVPPRAQYLIETLFDEDADD